MCKVVHEEIGLADAAAALVKDRLSSFSVSTQRLDKRNNDAGSQPNMSSHLEEVKRDIKEQEEPGHLADTIAGHLGPHAHPNAKSALEELNPIKRLQLIIRFLERGIRTKQTLGRYSQSGT